MCEGRIRLKILLVMVFLLLPFNGISAKDNSQSDLSTQDNKWKIGAKIHFEDESGNHYIGLREINALTRQALKSVFPILYESGDKNAKLFLKKENGDLIINHFTEKSRPNFGEEMHATLLYTTPRGFRSSETLKQVCDALFKNCDRAPDIATVSARYSAIIKPNWRFKISEIILVKNDKGPSFIMANLLHNNHNTIDLGQIPISAGLHLTLVNCEDSNIFADSSKMDFLIESLNNNLQGKYLKVALRNGEADLEFGISGQPWRLRAGKRIDFSR